jgi:hypothetical protein
MEMCRCCPNSCVCILVIMLYLFIVLYCIIYLMSVLLNSFYQLFLVVWFANLFICLHILLILFQPQFCFVSALNMRSLISAFESINRLLFNLLHTYRENMAL